MATVVFTALGTVLGGPVGGVLGALAGSQVDAVLFGSSKNPQGARLKDLSVTASTYGTVLPRHFGKMRVAGSVIWATDLMEHSSTTSSGKNKPSVTSYSYTSSFAVALASRPILHVGRIWADGKLLRGAEGDLKVGGSIRIYTGARDQAPDPLIASAEGTANCPAFRGTAYVVFEDLQLADFGNRIPTLNFEVFCDSGSLNLSGIFDGVVDNIDADVPLDDFLGFSCEEPLADTLSQFSPVLPLLCDAGGDNLTLLRERLQTAPVLVGEAVLGTKASDFGGKAGFARKRDPSPENPPRVIRYYDIDLDYQPGSQRAPGRQAAGQPKVLDLPACMSSTSAFRMIAKASRDNVWARDTLKWRCPELDPQVAPGTIVSLPDVAGRWRVLEWNWRSSGTELSLERVAPASTATMASSAAGQANLAPDQMVTATVIDAYELPWDGTGGNDSTTIRASLSSASGGWKGAALYTDAGDGQLVPIGNSGRDRATMGSSVSVLAAGPVTGFDRSNNVVVRLLAADMVLSGATPRDLVQGANRALLGSEIIQFGQATPLGDLQWRLEQLLRGRGGTEWAVEGHMTGEAFVLLDSAYVTLDSSKVPAGSAVRIGAIGLADPNVVESAIACRGIGTRPLAPVHGMAAYASDDSLTLSWVRRARGAWVWSDGVDVPLQEEAEAYQLGYGSVSAPLAVWDLTSAGTTLSAGSVASLKGSLPGGKLWVRQKGSYALSDPLLLAVLV